MNYSIFLLLLFQISGGLKSQGIEWEKGGWIEAQEKARASEQLIFVDVYTHWCRPCLQMDQDVFSDIKIGEYFNETFLSIKIDAEDGGAGQSLAGKYNINSYPHLLFIDQDGQLISSFVGFQNKFELLDIGRQTTELFSQYDFLQEVKSNLSKDYSEKELHDILTISRIHSFDGKEILTMKYLDKIKNITENDLRITMGEISRLDLSYLSRLTPLTTSLTYDEIYLRRNSQEWMSWKNETERAIDNLLHRYKLENNLNGFEQALEILKTMSGIKTRQIDNLYLNFYKQNNLEQYRTFAAYLIDEYIIPTRPEDVKKADEEKFRMLHKEIMKDMQGSIKSSSATVVGHEESSTTPFIDSLSQIYTISKRIADQLFEISGDFYAFYDDDSSRRKATFWASLAYLYYPYHLKYFDNHIYILETTGQETEAQEVREKVKLLPWYEEMRRQNSY